MSKISYTNLNLIFFSILLISKFILQINIPDIFYYLLFINSFVVFIVFHSGFFIVNQFEDKVLNNITKTKDRFYIGNVFVHVMPLIMTYYYLPQIETVHYLYGFIILIINIIWAYLSSSDFDISNVYFKFNKEELKNGWLVNIGSHLLALPIINLISL